MAQHSNEHLTIAQLSAYVDKELASDELALCDAHVQTCQPCQAALADLRLTSVLLGGLPQVEVPRSFALPTNMTFLPENPGDVEGRPRQSRPTYSIWRRSLRTLSTLAAVLGLIFVLAGVFASLPRGGVMTTASSGTNAPVTSSQPSEVQATDATGRAIQSPNVHATKVAPGLNTPTPATTPTNTPPLFSAQDHTSDQQSGPPAALDLGKTEGRLSIGSALFVLGILGFVATRRRRER